MKIRRKRRIRRNEKEGLSGPAPAVCRVSSFNSEECSAGKIKV